jgi:hypothetical protein
MKISERARATDSQATDSRPFGIRSWLHASHTTTLAAVAVGAFLFGSSQLGELPVSPSALGESAAIASDPNAKSAREAKRAERAAAREAKKKERASKKSDDRSLAKAKASKGSSGSSVDLGDDDPLEGL